MPFSWDGIPKIFRLPYQFDIETISAEKLINEIDLAFQAWQENVYSKNCSFDEFCEYILPYRRMNGTIHKLYHEQNKSMRWIADNLGINFRTVQKYLDMDSGEFQIQKFYCRSS